jgi:hypothetical protein
MSEGGWRERGPTPVVRSVAQTRWNAVVRALLELDKPTLIHGTSVDLEPKSRGKLGEQVKLEQDTIPSVSGLLSEDREFHTLLQCVW